MSHPSLEIDPILLARFRGDNPSQHVRFMLGFKSAEQYTRDIDRRRHIAQSVINPHGSERLVYFYSRFDLWIRFGRDVRTLLRLYNQISQTQAHKEKHGLSRRNP